MRQPSRRAVLGAALGFGTSGCLGTVRDTTGVEPAPLGTEQTLGGHSVTVSRVTVRDSVLYFETPESLAVAAQADERFVIASVTSEAGGPPRESFELRVDTDRYEVPDDGVDFGRGARGLDAPYDPAEGQRGRVTFLAPVGLDATEAQVVVSAASETAGWALDDRSVAHLRRGLPTFELAEVDAPTEVTADESVSVRLGVENVSSVPGVFRGVFTVGVGGRSYALELPVEPGKRTGWTHTFERLPSGATSETQFVLDSVIDGRQVIATTTVRAGTETGGEGSTTTDSPTPDGG